MNCKTQSVKLIINLGYEISVHLAFLKKKVILWDWTVYMSCEHASVLEGQ
jgi:hypothetical protein